MATDKALRGFTAAALQEWFERDQRRKELEREARQLAAENAVMAKDLQAALTAAGRTEIVRGDYRAGLVDGRATVAWKEEFIRVAGADAAAELAKAAPVKQHVSVTKIG